MPIVKKKERLRRIVGVSGLALSIVSFTIGAGIFALPAMVGIALGPFAIFGYVFCGIMLAAIMLCYAEIGSRITTEGGSYAYVEAVFGDFAGFVVNWIFLFGWSILGDAALLNIVADSLAVIFPSLVDPWMRALLFFILIGFMVIINIMSAKQGVIFVKFITLLKLLPLIAIIVFGFGNIKSANLHWEHLPNIKTFGNTALVLFFAFAGFESALGVSGEIKDPKRTVPFGILLGGLLVLILYLLLQGVTQGVLGAGMEAVKDAPLAAVAEKIIGKAGGTILLITAAVSCFGAVFGDVLNTPRVIFAGANDGIFPKFLGKVHSKYITPYMAILVFGILIFIFSISGGFKQLAILASAAILLVYLSVILATIKLRMTRQDASEKTFRIPGGLIIPIIGIASIVWLLTGLSKWEILSTVIFIAAIILMYGIMKWLKKKEKVTGLAEIS
jgi:amino acid transporter